MSAREALREAQREAQKRREAIQDQMVQSGVEAVNAGGGLPVPVGHQAGQQSAGQVAREDLASRAQEVPEPAPVPPQADTPAPAPPEPAPAPPEPTVPPESPTERAARMAMEQGPAQDGAPLGTGGMSEWVTEMVNAGQLPWQVWAILDRWGDTEENKVRLYQRLAQEDPTVEELDAIARRGFTPGLEERMAAGVDAYLDPLGVGSETERMIERERWGPGPGGAPSSLGLPRLEKLPQTMLMAPAAALKARGDVVARVLDWLGVPPAPGYEGFGPPTGGGHFPGAQVTSVDPREQRARAAGLSEEAIRAMMGGQ